MHMGNLVIAVYFHTVKDLNSDRIHTACFIRDTVKLPLCLSLKFVLMFSQNVPYGLYKLSLI